jgi:RHS repeat-associated protein
VKVRKQIDEQNWDEATSFSDSLGRTIRTQAKDSQGDVFTETKYDNLGRVAATSNPYRDGETIYWSKPRYDELNRVVETYAPEAGSPIDPNIHGASLGITEFGISIVPDFVGTYTTATDASGRKARSITNALGQLVRIDEPTGTNNDLGLIGSPNQPTFYKYNPQGKMVKVSQGQQNRYFLYDYLGRLIRVKQPEQEVNSALDLTDLVTNNNQWTAGFEYDIVGNLKKTTDAKGSIITNDYDKAGRVTLREYNNVDTPSVYYYYDGTGLATPPPTTNNFAKGKLTKVSSTISATQFTAFDNFGRTLTSEQITDGQTYTSKYKYNLSGALLEQTYPSGKVVRNFLESDGDLGKVVKNGKVLISDFDYTASGGIKSLKLGNGRFETTEFNSRHQVTQIGLGSTVAANDLWKVNYSHGELAANGLDVETSKNIGNIAKQVITIPNATFTQTYRYDSLNRIKEAKETAANNVITWQQSWDYDRFGNRISFNSSGIGLATNNTTPAINLETNRFISTQDFGYDKTGNVIKDKVNGNVRNFVFNGDNKQVHVKDANNVAIGTYYYDGNGARVKKTVGGEVTIFVYDGSGKLVTEYSTAIPTANPTVSYTTTDNLGSPRVITDKNGNVISRRDFMPFGEELNANNATNRLDTQKYNYGEDSVRKRFTGYEKDQETGLDFAESRYYNNKHGRFTAVDPLLASGKSSNPQTFNRYAYVGNNPLTRVDTDGKDWVIEVTKEKGKISYRPLYVPKAADYARKAPNIWEITKNGKTIGYQALSPYTANASEVFKTRKQAQAAYEKLAIDDYPGDKSDDYGSYMTQSNGDITPHQEIKEGGVQEAINPLDVALFCTPFKGSLFLSGASRTTDVLAEKAAERTTSTALSTMEQGYLVNGTARELAGNGLARNVAGYEVAGTFGKVGNTYNANIWSMFKTANSSRSMFAFTRALETEARNTGANQISILGTHIINRGFFNPANVQRASRLGYTFRVVNENTIHLCKPLF